MGAAEIATTTEVATIDEAVMISAMIEVDDPGIATARGVGNSRPFADGYRVTGPTGGIDVVIDAGYGRGAIICIPGSGYGSHSAVAMADPGPTAAKHKLHRPPSPARRSYPQVLPILNRSLDFLA